MTATPLSAKDAIAALQGHEAWAIIRRSTRAGDRDTVGLVGGRRSEVESLLDVPLEEGVPPDGRIADRLLAIPFRQVRERGFEAHDDGTPLVVVDVETELEFSVAEIVDAIDDTGVEFADRGGFETDDEEYAKLVEAIIHDEIGQGEGANLVIGRHYRATARRLGCGRRAERLQATARAGARRLLDLRVLHRRPLPDRRQPRTPRHHPRRRRADEPDQRHLPDPARRRREGQAARLPGRREGDLRALHGRRRRAQDDVRHLPRGRPGARPVPQADEPPRAHRVPPRRPHRPRSSRRCCATRCTPPPSPARRSRTRAG